MNQNSRLHYCVSKTVELQANNLGKENIPNLQVVAFCKTFKEIFGTKTLLSQEEVCRA